MHLVHDLRYAARRLKQSPAFLAIAVLTLALGIGANVAIFTLVNAVLLRPLPFPEPARLVRIFDDLQGAGATDVGVSVPELVDLGARAGVFEAVTAVYPVSTALSGGDRVDRIEMLGTSPTYFQLLGAQAALGRVYTAADWVPGFLDGVVISDGLWKRQFGGDPHVIGRRIRVDEDGYTIVGVMPADFRHPGPTLAGDVDLWAATGFLAAPFPDPPIRRARIVPGAMARLAPGLTLAQAQAHLDAFVGTLAQTYPTDYPPDAHWGLRLEPVQQSWVGSVGPTLLVLLVAVGVVLLIVCANIASLLLTRASARGRELAIRQALGASRRRLVSQVLSESVLISLAGGTAAFVALRWTQAGLVALLPADVPRLGDVHADWRVFGLALGLTVATGVLFGVAPALQASSIDPTHDLKEGGRSGSGPSRRQSRARSVLVVAEVALSVVLLVGAGLLLRSFGAALGQAPGLEPAGLTVGQIWIPVPNNPKANPYLTSPERAVLARELLRRLGSLPGVEGVALSTSGNIPFLHSPNNPVPFSFPDERAIDHKDHAAIFGAVSPDYFAVLKAAVTEGRTMTTHDAETTARVLMVNRAFVRAFSTDRSVVGRHLRDGGGREFEIVGVVGDIRDEGLDAPARPRMYASLFQLSSASLAVFLRARPGVDVTGDQLAQIVHAVDPELPVFGVRTMDALMSTSLARRRFALLLMSVFAGVAVFLAALGLYGVMSFIVGQRLSEYGLRLALGASRGDIVLLACRPGLWLTGLGTIVGLGASVLATRLMSTLLFGVPPRDPATFIAVPLVLGAASLLACLMPARRAIRVSPVEALRS